MGIIGSKSEVIDIKEQILEYFSSKLGLNLNTLKTKITLGTTERVRFLKFYISIVPPSGYKQLYNRLDTYTRQTQRPTI